MLGDWASHSPLSTQLGHFEIPHKFPTRKLQQSVLAYVKGPIVKMLQTNSGENVSVFQAKIRNNERRIIRNPRFEFHRLALSAPRGHARGVVSKRAARGLSVVIYRTLPAHMKRAWSLSTTLPSSRARPSLLAASSHSILPRPSIIKSQHVQHTPQQHWSIDKIG